MQVFKETLQIPPQRGTQFQAAEVCWLCIYPIHCEKVRDHDHQSAKHRVGSHKLCNLQFTQKQSNFVVFFHNTFSLIVIYFLNNS